MYVRIYIFMMEGLALAGWQSKFQEQHVFVYFHISVFLFICILIFLYFCISVFVVEQEGQDQGWNPGSRFYPDWNFSKAKTIAVGKKKSSRYTIMIMFKRYIFQINKSCWQRKVQNKILNVFVFLMSWKGCNRKPRSVHSIVHCIDY